jgi:cystathionine beta-lyase
VIVDLTDAQARRVLGAKWGMVGPDVLPAWVAEMDYLTAPPVVDALTRLVREGGTGYPNFEAGGAVGDAYTGFARRRFGWSVPTGSVMLAGHSLGGIRLLLEHWAEPGPVAVHLPAYHPFLDLIPHSGHLRLDLPLDPDAAEARMDLDQLDRAFLSGARTLLLCNPHNPWGRAFTREELEGVRDVVTAHGARVIADEIHGPLVLPGAAFTPYLSLPGTTEHAVAVVAASKAFNLAGLHCAQLIVPAEEFRERLEAAPFLDRLGLSPMGITAAVAAYAEGDPWLDALLARLDSLRAQLGGLLAEHLPEARMRPLEATYLAWLDLRAYGHEDPATVALDKGRVRLDPGAQFQPGLPGHARLNVATSPERLAEIVARLASAIG